MPISRVNNRDGNAHTGSEGERQQLLAEMARFDAEQRDRYWRGWEQRRSEPYAIQQSGQLYPVGHLVRMTIERLRYKSKALAVAFLRTLGFTVVEVPRSLQRTSTPARPNRRRQTRPTGRRMTASLLAPFHLTLAPKTPPARVFRSEREFELQVIEPHLEAWGCGSRTQVTRSVHRGKQKLHGRIDFVVRRPNSRAVLTIIEAKREIRSLAQLYQAARQAESYARALRLRHFVVAAPQGCWIFSRAGRTFQQLTVYGPDIWDGRAASLQTRLHELVGFRSPGM